MVVLYVANGAFPTTNQLQVTVLATVLILKYGFKEIRGLNCALKLFINEYD